MSPLTVKACRFQNNVSAYAGGGLFAAGNSHRLLGKLFAGNGAGYGAAIRCVNATAAVGGCTLLGNTGGTAIHASGLQQVVLNSSIVWGNLVAVLGNVTTAYCHIQGINTADPKVTADGHLQAGSPCMNTGDPTYLPQADETDIDGQARIAVGRIDIGCDEVAGTSKPGDTNGDGYVNVGDLQILVASWGRTIGEALVSRSCRPERRQLHQRRRPADPGGQLGQVARSSDTIGIHGLCCCRGRCRYKPEASARVRPVGRVAPISGWPGLLLWGAAAVTPLWMRMPRSDGGTILYRPDG